MSGYTSRELGGVGDQGLGQPQSGRVVDDPFQNERYQFWGPSGSQAERSISMNTGNTALAQNQRLQFDDPQMMTLSQTDQQKVMALWANANGMDMNDQNSYTKMSQSADGKSVAVGPFKLDAGTIANDWLDGMVNSQGLVDQGALDNYVQQGKISPETAAAVASPEFMQFMQKLAAGQQPSAEEIATYLPPDLQQAIAGDLANAGAAIVGMQGGQLDTNNIVSTVQNFSAQAGPMQQFDTAPPVNDGGYNPDPDGVSNNIPVDPIEATIAPPVVDDGTDPSLVPYDTTYGAAPPPADEVDSQ